MKLRQKQLRDAGFTQRKPSEPGIYFYHEARELAAFGNPTRLAEGWDVASIFWNTHNYAGMYDGHHPNGNWSMKTLSGANFRWRKGMWIKGPVHPFATHPTTARPAGKE